MVAKTGLRVGDLVLPAWRRYSGKQAQFYRSAGSALSEAVAVGNVVIVSGGYGLVRGDEPIGYYNHKFDRRDWSPAELLSALLLAEAKRPDISATLAFVGFGAQNPYAALLRRTRWSEARKPAWNFRVDGPRTGPPLGRAFAAFWAGGKYPCGSALDPLE